MKTTKREFTKQAKGLSIFVLFKQDRLRSSLSGFRKVGQPYADEPIPLPCLGCGGFTQLIGLFHVVGGHEDRGAN
jgi:hypothetical protein